MTVAAVSMFKDEADVAGHVLRHLAEEGIDLLVVADNGSTDGTREILDRAQEWMPERYRGLRVVILDDPEPGFYQSQKMTRLADEAHKLGATWILPFDADEVWFSRPERIGVFLESLPETVGVATAVLYNHFGSALDPQSPIPFDRLVWRQRQAASLPKVAFRWSEGVVVEQGNHSVSGAQGITVGGLEVRHFPYRSLEQFIRKAINGAAAYAATDLPEHQGAHWRGYGALLKRYGDAALKEVFEQYYYFLSPVDAGLVHDPAPFRRWIRGT
jgi:hypothetical protein